MYNFFMKQQVFPIVLHKHTPLYYYHSNNNDAGIWYIGIYIKRSSIKSFQIMYIKKRTEYTTYYTSYYLFSVTQYKSPKTESDSFVIPKIYFFTE